MPVACSYYDEEYKLVQDVLRTASFAAPLGSVMSAQAGILQDEGPQHNLGGQLDRMRRVMNGKDEGKEILESCGITPGSNQPPNTEAVKKAASMKFLRHLHMMRKSGSQEVWVYSSPKAYTKYTWEEIATAGASTTALQTSLNQKDEVFSHQIKSRLAEATREGMVWVSKTLILLALAKSNQARAKAMVDRWFAPAAADYATAVEKLTNGFKAIQNTLSANNVVITDHPPDRSVANMTEAYVYSTARPRAIYIEKALMKNYDISVLHDMKKNWTRVVVHECTHLDAATDDDGGYAYRGIKPQKITSALAIKNADNWAFFAADCAGALTDGERLRALEGTGGTLDVLPSNWK